jgi:N-acetylglucosamine-6-phosphate deacetylase
MQNGFQPKKEADRMSIWRGRHYQSNEITDFQVEYGAIQSIAPSIERDRVRGGEQYWITPGLVDLQVNGFLGYDFGSAKITPDGVEAVAQALEGAGVTSFCPTVTTNAADRMEASLRTIAQACEARPLVQARVAGIHLEGPFISPLDGPRGAHPRQYVRDPNWETFERFQAAAGGRIRLVTLAPELPGGLEFIAKARTAGIVVAIGHHAATRALIEAAVAAGAVLSTHLGNGAHQLIDRHNNYIWEQMANDDLLASIIVDGHHLPPAVVKSIYRVKGPQRLILVSDAISAAGLPPGDYRLMDADIQVLASGRVQLKGTPYLAGSTLQLWSAIPNLMEMAGASFSEAVSMATENPARLLGLGEGRGELVVGRRADLCLFRLVNSRFVLAMTIAAGEVCYQAAESL